MNSPQVSVVIPAYNHEKFVGPAIESVLNQSFQDFELIVVDDGSTDNTAGVIKDYTDPRISYTWQENQDAFNTINRGMRLARGEYISILNSDDVYTLDRLEVLVNFAQNNRAQCVFTDVIPISDEGKEYVDPNFGWNTWHQGNREYYRQYDDLYTGFLHGNFMVTTSNLFMRKDAVGTVGAFAPIRYLHDYDFIFRMMLAFPEGVFYLEREKLLYYRIHAGNTLSEAAITGREQDLEVIEKYMLEKLPENYRDYVETGSRRLRSLEKEIFQVRQELEANRENKHAGPIRSDLIARIRRKLCRMWC